MSANSNLQPLPPAGPVEKMFIDFSRLEEDLLHRFRTDNALSGISRLDDRAFLSVLVQRRFLSLAYSPLIDFAIDLLIHPAAKRDLRHLLQEEYPANGPSHREELVADLFKAGLSREDLIKARPTRETEETIKKFFLLLQQIAGSTVDPDAGLITAFRLWGEVLVAEEFMSYFDRLKTLGLSEVNSRFYWPHIVHDKKTTGATGGGQEPSHSDLLEQTLRSLIHDGCELESCAAISGAVIEIKTAFYRQFRNAPTNNG